MSIDDKMEKRFREQKLTDKRNGSKSSNNELSYEGFSVEPEKYVQASATQIEPMDFCPECNGMMLPYLDGHKCNDCGFTKGVSEELIEKTKKDNIYTREITTNAFQTKESTYRRTRISRPIEKEVFTPTLSPEELKDKLINLDGDIFDIVLLILGVPKSLEKEEKIDYIVNNYKEIRIDSAIDHAKKIKP